MALLRALIGLKMATALPEDEVVNSLYFSTGDTATATQASIRTAVIDVYKGVEGTLLPISGWLSQHVALTGHDVTLYNMDDPRPRAPLSTETFNFASTNAAAEASELALVMSFQAAKQSGSPQARRRGRIYLGPFGHPVNDSSRPHQDLIATVRASGARLKTASNSAVLWTWIVYSAAFAGTPTRPAYARSFAAVDNGWVDNAWDIQRRRGIQATTRRTF